MARETVTEDPRFDGFRTLVGDESYRKIHAASVCIVGLGGVGSWVAEALARCGVGTLTLVDLDDVCVTNVNRQLQALDSTVGLPKAEVLAARLSEINPRLRAIAVTRFFSAHTADELLAPSHDIVIDCIDRVTNKSLLIARCVQQGIRVLTVGSAGRRLDPGAVRIADLARTLDDPLLAYVRKKLRQEHGFPRKERKKFGVPAVFSPLPPQLLMTRNGSGTLCGDEDLEAQEVEGPRSCNDGLGTAVFVTGTMGLFAAAEAVRIISSAQETAEPGGSTAE